MSYRAGLDLGSTCSAVASCRSDRVSRLEVLVPAVVSACPDGTLVEASAAGPTTTSSSKADRP